jgi:hypothetical protein
MIQIPYSEIGIGVALILGAWAFIVAEDERARAVFVGLPGLIFLIRLIFPSPAGRLMSLIGWILYGIGCLIFLRLSGVAVR